MRFAGWQKSGMTLTEIMIAALVIAIAFMPIIGVMGTSVKATAKDDAIIRGMNLCQEKLNTTLRFPFNYFRGNLGAEITEAIFNHDGLELDLRDQTINGIQYRTVLIVDDRPGQFTVPERDLNTGDSNNPSTWSFDQTTVNYSDLVNRYRMTVFWRESGADEEQFYSLVSFRANLRSFDGG